MSIIQLQRFKMHRVHMCASSWHYHPCYTQMYSLWHNDPIFFVCGRLSGKHCHVWILRILQYASEHGRTHVNHCVILLDPYDALTTQIVRWSNDGGSCPTVKACTPWTRDDGIHAAYWLNQIEGCGWYRRFVPLVAHCRLTAGSMRIIGGFEGARTARIDNVIICESYQITCVMGTDCRRILATHARSSYVYRYTQYQIRQLV